MKDEMEFARDLHTRIAALPDDTALSHDDFLSIARSTARRHPIDFVRFWSWLKESTTLRHVANFMQRLVRSRS